MMFPKQAEFLTTKTPLLTHKRSFILLNISSKICNFTERYHKYPISLLALLANGIAHKSPAKPIKHTSVVTRRHAKIYDGNIFTPTTKLILLFCSRLMKYR